MRRWGMFAALAVALVAILWAVHGTGLPGLLRDQARWGSAVRELRGFAGQWWVGPAFAAVYGLLAGLAFPALPLTVIGGAAFGVGPGLLWVSLGANLGGSLAFWLARSLGRETLVGILGDRIRGFDRVTGAAGFHGVLTLRLLPVTPFSLFSYACGVTPIPWRPYAVATFIGILPGTAVYVFFADALIAGSAEASQGALLRAAGAGLLLALLSLGSRWLRRRAAPGTTPGPGEGPA